MRTRLATSTRPRRTIFLSGIVTAFIISLCLAAPVLATGSGANINGPVVASGSTAISGSVVVWSEIDSFSGHNQIYWRDFSASGAAAKVNASSNNQISPAIYGTTVVWQESGDLYYKDVTGGGAVRLTDNGDEYPKFQPTICGTLVAWSEFRDEDNRDHVYMKLLSDTGNGTPADTTDTTSNQIAPALSGRFLVWESWDGMATSLRGRRVGSPLFNPFDLCTAAGNQNAPSISDGLVAWEDDHLGHSQIYYYNLDNGLPNPFLPGTLLSGTLSSNQTQPCASANRIAWVDDRNGADNKDIYTRDIAQAGYDAEVHLVNDMLNQAHPVLSGDKIAWESYRQDGSGIGWDVKVLKTDPVAVFYSGFETNSVAALDSGWTVGRDSAFPAAADAYWGESTTYAVAGTHSLWMAGHGGQGGQYVNDMAAILSRRVDLTGYTGASMGFSYKSKMPLGDAGDLIFVQIRDAAGAEIPGIGTSLDTTLDQNTPNWPTDWRYFNIDLTPVAGRVISVRLYEATNTDLTDSGAYVDDFFVSGFSDWPAAVPKGTVTILPTDPAVPGFVKTSTVTLQLDAADFTGSQVGLQMAFSNNGVNWSPAEPYGTFKVWDLNNATYGGTAGEGPKTVYAKFIDALGVPSADPQATAPIHLDSTAPTSPTVGINGPASITTPIVDLAVSAVDGDVYGLAEMQFSNDGSHWSAWEAYGLLRTNWDLTAAAYGGTSGSGTKRVYARFRDPAGNISATSPAASVTYTSVAPTGAIYINGVAEYTNLTVVSLDLSATATNPATVTDMRFSNDRATWSDWETYGTSKSGWDITSAAYGGGSANGTKTVYVQFRDSMTRVSTSSISDTIVYDTGAPTLSTIVVAPPHQPSIWSNDNSITMSWSGGSDALSGVTGIARLWSTSATSIPDPVEDVDVATGTYTRNNTPNGSSWYFHLRTRDGAGNWSTTAHLGPYFIDTALPTGTVQINGGDTGTSNSQVTLTLNGADTGGSGLNQMRFSNNGTLWSDWEGYGATKTAWDITSGTYGGTSADGTKTVYAQFKDAAENVSSVTISDTIIYAAVVADTTAPTGTITINEPTRTAILSNLVTLHLTANDPGTPTSGVASMRFSNDGTTWLDDWEPFATTKTNWSLTDVSHGGTLGHGLKTVYVQFRDNAGNPSLSYFDMVNLWADQDFNKDGSSDVAMLYDYGNSVSRLWLFNSNGATVAPAPAPWYGPGFNAARVKMVHGDFNGDGRSDVAMLYDYGNAISRLWLFTSSGTTVTVSQGWYGPGFDANRVTLTSGDYNGDGLCDIAMLYNYGNANSRLWTFISNGTTLTPAATPWFGPGFDAARAKVVSGDYNGDGKCDVAMLYDYGNATSRVWLFTSTGAGWTNSVAWSGGPRAFDASRVKLTSGDYDGDGDSDIGMLYDNGGATSRLWKFTSDGTVLTPSDAWHGTGFDAGRVKLTSGDINGDHISDVEMLYDYGNATSRLWKFTSNGVSMLPALAWTGNGFDASRVKLTN